MHLLVLSAFRRTRVWNEAMTMLGMSQCTFWCSMLSDAGTGHVRADGRGTSQCTFWCSMLSDPEEDFLCPVEAWRVSMHLLVLSAFRLSMYGTIEDGILKSQCTFWCSVLSDSRGGLTGLIGMRSQCTFWCSVLSDSN